MPSLCLCVCLRQCVTLSLSGFEWFLKFLRCLFAGTNIQTNEEVAIKLVSIFFAFFFSVFLFVFLDFVCYISCYTYHALNWAEFAQENVKTKHPQLQYESKLYKLLQGGSNDLFFF